MQPSDFTLLVVDDNEENVDLLSRRLRRKGFNVLTAGGGRPALELLARRKVDLVLLDIMMPEVTGLDVLKALRERPETEELPVIMASAKSESEDIVEALELGANDYVTKPLDFPVVFARVMTQLKKRPARPAQASVAPGEIGPGLVLADRYRLDSKIGAGNFGAVFRATHLELEKPVAVKVLQATVNAAGDAVTRFRREGVAACRIRHPNAVAILDFGVTPGGVAFLAMELLDGRSLEDELRERSSLSPRRCRDILTPVLGALAEAHAQAIVHRDVKPANVFLHRTGAGEVPKVLDFGIAKIVGETALAQKLTVEGFILGTPAYMAPERFRNQPYDGRSDVYSVGVMLYQMLAGTLPFDSPDPMGVVSKHLHEPPPPLGRFNPWLTPEIEAVVLRALAKQPADRPSAAELAELLRGFEDDADVELPPADLELIGSAPTRAEPSDAQPVETNLYEIVEDDEDGGEGKG